MNAVSNKCVESLSLARGDVGFGNLQDAHFMLIVEDSMLRGRGIP